MADVLRIKRRVTGVAGAPPSLANAEIAYNEQDHILYYGEGTGGAGGTASVISPIAGQGLAYTLNPAMNGVAGAGSLGAWARGDHVHPSDTSRAPLASPSFTGAVTIGGTIGGAGMVAWSAAPGPIGSTTASTGAFTNITVTGTISGLGITANFAAPPPIGSTTPNSGSFTTLTASGVVSGAGFTALLAGYALLAGPTFSGTVTVVNLTASGTVTLPTNSSGVTAIATDSSTLLATTAFVKAQAYITSAALPVAANVAPLMDAVTAVIGISSLYARQDHVHPSDSLKANLASPTFSGTPNLPTGTIGFTQTYPNNTTALATTAFVSTNFAPITSPNFLGTPTALSASNAGVGTSTTQLATTAYAMGVRQDQQGVPGADVSWNNFKITNLADPINPTDASNKRYVDQNATGLSARGAVQAATTANLGTFPPTGPQTIDGYTTSTTTGDRILVKDQVTQANNGIYVAGGTGVLWARATDMDAWTEVPNAYVFVTNGTVNSASSWVCNSPLTGGTLGTTAITWVQFSQQAQVTAGGGLTRTGNSFDVIGTANRITVFADNIDIAATYVGQSTLTTLGTITSGIWNGTDIAVPDGGTGVSALTTGYVRSNGTSAFTSVSAIPNTDVTGLQGMALQAPSAVAITGGTIDGVTFDMGTF